jgi:50S ribosomal protein L16 3-hydroxylase
MKVQSLFGEFQLCRFIDEHLHRLPLALPNVCQEIQPLGTWPCLASLLAAPGVDVMVVHQGTRHEGPAPTDLQSAQRLCAHGCTIVVRHAERHNDEIARLAAAFVETFHCPVNVHVYATPPDCHGFSWHYDAEDVFILQTAGEKEYVLRKNTVNPWPLEEAIPADMQYDRELMPLMRVLLRAGDLLYIPCGYWHRAYALPSEETAISLAVGIMSYSAMDVFDFLRGELLQSLVWRQRLPIVTTTSAGNSRERNEAYKHVLEQLAKDIARTMTGPQFLSRVAEHFQRESLPADDV